MVDNTAGGNIARKTEDDLNKIFKTLAESSQQKTVRGRKAEASAVAPSYELQKQMADMKRELQQLKMDKVANPPTHQPNVERCGICGDFGHGANECHRMSERTYEGGVDVFAVQGLSGPTAVLSTSAAIPRATREFPAIAGPQQYQNVPQQFQKPAPPQKPSLEDTMQSFMAMTKQNMESQSATIKRLEIIVGQLTGALSQLQQQQPTGKFPIQDQQPHQAHAVAVVNEDAPITTGKWRSKIMEAIKAIQCPSEPLPPFTVAPDHPPLKQRDLDSFIFNISLGGVEEISRMLDLGATVNLMPLDIFENLKRNWREWGKRISNLFGDQKILDSQFAMQKDIPGALIVNGVWKIGDVRCCLVNVYAPQRLQDREQLWDRLDLVVRQNRDTCVCFGGDFNSIRNIAERNGRGTQVSTRDIQLFDLFVRRSQMEEIRLQARTYTWYQPQGMCKSKLDRFMVNEEWLSVWAHTKARGLQRSISDHCPILLETKKVDWGPKPFRFFNAWTRYPDFDSVVLNSWQRSGISGRSSFVFKEKIKRLKEDLKVWSRSGFGIVEENISNLKKEILKWDSIDDIFGLEEEEALLKSEAEANLFTQLQHRDSTLAQRARNRWLKDGDLNSSLFHKAINGRRAKNDFSGLFVDGAWIQEPFDVKRAVKEHFHSQFRKRLRARSVLPADFVNRKISDSARVWLDRPFSVEEVKMAVWNCDSGKSPGPDGFNFLFMKRCWEVIKGDLMEVMREFHANDKLVRGSNSSFVVLIPKKTTASELRDFRPISLISCMYKVIAKVLAARLQQVLKDIISEPQSAFVEGRFILDGVVVLNELIEFAKKKRRGLALFKADFAKAYDTVDWDFLDKMLELFNFSQRWRRWISGCLRSASTNVLVNGSPSGEFQLERGIRQGDPLSPFLFLVVAEGLNILTERAVQRGLLEPFNVENGDLRVSHLQYADDTMFLVSEKVENARAIRSILKIFEVLSGLTVNFEKSCFVGINIQDDAGSVMADHLKCCVGSLPVKYLGVKIGGHLSRATDWSYVVERVKRKINGWKERRISFAGRVTLLRSVLFSIPIYQLSFSKIPKKVLSEIRSLMCKFLWVGGVEGKKICWVKWEELCREHREGGLGLKNLEWFNSALMAKWLWRFLSERESLWARVIKSCQGEIFWDGGGFRLKGRSEPKTGWWRKVLSLSWGPNGKWLRENLEIQVGNGASVLFWHHCWIGESNLSEIFPRLCRLSTNQNGSISSMGEWREGNWVWNFNWSRELWDREKEQVQCLENMISQIRIEEGKTDKWRWKASKGDIFSVKSAYRAISTDGSHSPNRGFETELSSIWKAPAPPKVITTAWKVLRGKLATCDNLLKRKVVIQHQEALCVLCKTTTETVDHLFFSCEKSYQLWSGLVAWLGKKTTLQCKVKDHFNAFINLGCKKEKRFLLGVWAGAIWSIWKMRNECKFQQGEWNCYKVEAELKSRFWSWMTIFNVQKSPEDFRSWFGAARTGE
ncbi:uncharacterized protein LOC130998670 [Salvia miltiorrhiza]|uniref:uncharacterized protein LOC130998670 n=1 Tax=Salvia miltiorrhiza TaxID=226208 RepID=UPI0025AB8E2D|nr:uncharacterized protein LOC130998670 [Salvia miltiorrhiza]